MSSHITMRDPIPPNVNHSVLPPPSKKKAATKKTTQNTPVRSTTAFPTKEFACYACEYECTILDDFKIHLSLQHPNDHYECKRCLNKFFTPKMNKQHMDEFEH